MSGTGGVRLNRIVWLARLLFCLLVLAVLVLIALADTGASNPLLDWSRATYNADKLGHFVVYGLLAFLLHLSLRAACWRPARWLPLPKAAVWVLAFGLAEELTQLFSSVRTFDLRDLAANLAGVVLFTLLAALLWRVAQPSSAAQRS